MIERGTMMKRFVVLSLILAMGVSSLAARHYYRYGWEDVDTLSYPEAVLNIYSGRALGNVETTTVYAGNQSLKLVDNNTYANDYGEQVDLCWIQGLQEGDIVKGSFWRYNESPGAGCRIDAYYTQGTGLTYDYWHGDSSYTERGTGNAFWEKVDFTWVYTEIDSYDQSVHTGLVICARPYYDAGDVCYVDDLEIEIPDHATVNTPPIISPLLPGNYDEMTVIPDGPIQERSYGWEDGYADVLGFFGNVYEPQNAEDPNGLANRVLKAYEYPIGDTPQLFVALIKDLQDGDVVTAGFSAFDNTPTPVGGTDADGYPSVRIWAHYADSNDITSYLGSAGGNDTYSDSDPNGWSRLENTWAFAPGDTGADALMIEARLYSPTDATAAQEFYIDDVNVIAPEAATIIFPGDVYLAADYSTRPTYGWENFTGPATEQNVLLGTFGMVNAELELFDPYAGSNALLLTDAEDVYTMSTLRQLMNRGYTVDLNGSATPEGYLAVVTGLNNGERVNVSIQAKSNSANPDTGVRLWAHYIYDENDTASYAGSAGGFAAYPNDTTWAKLSYPWTFVANPADPYVDPQGTSRIPVGMVIKARAYSENGEGGVIDDLIIEAPVTATVEYPDPANDDICVGGLPEYDFNLDCQVTLDDFADFAGGWLGCNLQPLCN